MGKAAFVAIGFVRERTVSLLNETLLLHIGELESFCL